MKIHSDVWELSNDVGDVFDHYDSFKDKLKKGYEKYREREKRNPQLLRAFLEKTQSGVAKLNKTVLLTGANGFLGTQIARRLLKNDEVTVLALVRAADTEEGARRLARDWWDWPELVDAIGT